MVPVTSFVGSPTHKSNVRANGADLLDGKYRYGKTSTGMGRNKYRYGKPPNSPDKALETAFGTATVSCYGFLMIWELFAASPESV